jgi:cytochrome b561
MNWRNTTDSYGAIAKLLHWSIVLLLIAQFIFASLAEDLPDGAGQLEMLGRHKSFGMLILLLALARIAWRLANPTPRPAPGTPRWQRIAAASTHGLLYLLILAQPLVGWAMSSAGGHPVALFDWFAFPAIVAPDHDLHEALEEVHELLAGTIVAVAALHAAAALYHHFLLRDDVLRRMLPFGAKRGG